MVATAPAAPSSPAGSPAQGRSASRIASDARGTTEVMPENDVSRRVEHRHSHSDRRVAATCIGHARPYCRASHRARRRFSSQSRNGRYYRARYYHPGLQRFISEDPIGLAAADPNLYAYVRNAPLRYRDPMGWWGVGGVVGGNAELGLPVLPGAAAQFTEGWGLFGGGCHGIRDDAFVSAGAFATPMTLGERITLGAYAGFGGGWFFTNATNVSQIGGPGDTWTLDVSAGSLPIKGSLSLSFSGGGIWTLTATGGWGWGAGVSRTPTTTWHGPVAECRERSKSSR
jgi:RHS repeat-associated protein